ncbi:MAG: glucosidase [Myxococcales bacterium]|nr:glucosidase [Myxococcales bacterium]
MDAERVRQAEQRRGEQPWALFGPYLSERAWATVREDYSASGDAWAYFPHDHARSRVYRWNEDGLCGISDDKQRLCFALALWNERDPFLKERLFGVTGPEGNHGEDVKEVYWYLDSTPTHSYMAMRYRYPQAAYPYERLVAESQRRGRTDPEFELADAGVLADDRFFDVDVTYAKAAPDDVLIIITASNRGPEPAPLHVLPTLWFRNTWSWGRDDARPSMSAIRRGLHNADEQKLLAIAARHHELGEYVLCLEDPADLLFTGNETNNARLWRAPNAAPYVKDAFHRHVVDREPGAVDPGETGTKAAAHLRLTLAPRSSRTVRLRLVRCRGPHPEPPPGLPHASTPEPPADPFADFDEVLAARRREADEFYAALQPPALTDEERRVQRQALAGMLWTKQFYHYIVRDWLHGDPGQPPPPPGRTRNRDWAHLYNERVMSMPDKWEYPWYAAWDLAFHCIPLALVDIDFAKEQLDLLTREWYQHPNGAIPAYEWNFGDVNPPVTAWATWRVYKIEQRHAGSGDRHFLETIFHKLLIHFTWWVNRKDSDGQNIFQGGFLGLDNIGVFDRSHPVPGAGVLEQSDATSWMGMFCLNMMQIALELARDNHAYENIASKFFEHFLAIADAMNNLGGQGIGLWDEDDEFFYDVLHLADGRFLRLKVRSLVGLIPLLAVETVEPDLLERLPGFRKRLEWYLAYRPDLARLVSRWQEPGLGERRLLALVRGSRMKRLLRRMLDPGEFLADHGVRSLSKHHARHPYELRIGGQTMRVGYEPGESQTGLFGGNSNWRGPIWFPINFLLIESLQKFHHYYGDDFLVEYPTGSGHKITLRAIADELARRLTGLFLRGPDERRPFAGPDPLDAADHTRDSVLFHEYFHGDSGRGLGASHQTGWTGLVAKLLHQQGMRRGGSKCDG